MSARLSTWMIALGLWGLSSAAIVQAATLNFNSSSGPGEQQLTVNPVSVSIQVPRSATPDGDPSPPVVTVQVSGKTVFRALRPDLPGMETLLEIAEMDASNPYPEVIISHYTGGAHCCNKVEVISSDSTGNQWRSLDLGTFDGGPHPLADVDGDGRSEFVDVDNRFLYQFSSYAGSAPPVQVWQLNNGKFVDVSQQPQFRRLHEEQAEQMLKALQETPPRSPDSNGLLAGYAATQAILGQFPEAWKLVESRYEPSEWGLEECLGAYDDQGRCKGQEVRYKNFPEALRAFLQRNGYLPAADR